MAVFPTEVLFKIFDARYWPGAALPPLADRLGKLLAFNNTDGSLEVVSPPTAVVVYANSATPQDAIVTSGVLSGDTDLNLCAANDSSAKPTVFAKIDDTGFIWSIVDPNGGTFKVDVQYQAIRLVPLAALNIWVKQG